MAVNPVPKGYHSVTPYLVVNGVERLIEFLKKTFDAQGADELMRRPDGSVAHAEIRVGDSKIMMGEPMPGQSVMPATLYVYVGDTDAVYRRALGAGGTSLMAPADKFYGDRNAGVKDPVGNHWYIGTRVEEVSPEEMTRRAEAVFKRQGAA